jgi:methylated-DNA-[protein]-cysteine S-methyltransferase
MVGGMRAARTEYAVPGWGVGELWVSEGGDLVLAHEFAFHPELVRESRAAQEPGDVRVAGVGARPPKGAHGPPTGTVPGKSVRVGHDSASASQQVSQALNGPPVDTDDLVERFAAFFAGADPHLDEVPVDLEWATPFQHAVALTLRAVPRGEVVTYGELAALAGFPGAARAAGTFCAHNRLMLLVPCHRVVGATGLGGYGSAGLGVKRRLLELEGIEL